MCIAVTYCIFHSFQQLKPPMWLQPIAYLIYTFIQGFFWWCIFVVGHDCGHGSFSNNTSINAFMGHIFHGSIYVPFWPWALSHHRHHLNHNHKIKDYSNPWHDELDQCGDLSLKRLILPVIAWPMYLILGYFDGTHFLPLPTQRLYAKATSIESIQCIISSIAVFLWAFIYRSIFGSWSEAAFYTVGPFIGFGWWLFTVTYFQHHGDFSIVYSDDTWSFETAAFQTIDRTFGSWIDYFHHRITDCHVIHHLFFLKIPHYHLREATDALVQYLKKNDLEYLYQFEPTEDFIWRVFSEVHERGLTYKEHVTEYEKCEG